MRTVPSGIWSLWDNGGPFIGDDGAPHSRVTVEENWQLNLAYNAGKFPKVPVRWWQNAANDQSETEVPNIRSIQIDRSLDSDAARCTIALSNQWHFNNGAVAAAATDELGQPGYFSFNRGSHADATARWGHVANDWNGVLVPNALLRTYQGYGGRTKTVDNAITDGNIILTGVWLIDSVTLTTDGIITLSCRDMAKLLIDQFVFPPLVPDSYYPPSYCRWYFSRGSNAEVIYGDHAAQSYDRSNSLSYSASSGDDTGLNLSQAGHYPSDALDQATNKSWLSPGMGAATDFVYFELNVSESINALLWVPFNGEYQMYVSIMENGVWQGAETIPAGSGLDIAYVFQTGVPFETSGTQSLERVYQAQRVRFTFTNLYRFDIGGVTFRAGMRELSVGRLESSLPTKKIYGLAPAQDDAGYWLIGSDGGVFTIGEPSSDSSTAGIPPSSHPRFYGSSGGGGTDNEWTAIAPVADGSGYWTVRKDGRVFEFGSAIHYGDPFPTVLSGPIIDMAATTTGLGYWLLGGDGGIFAHGDAVYYGRLPTVTIPDLAIGFEARPQNDGYWILQTNGEITTYGAAVHYGDGSDLGSIDGIPTGLASTSNGAGYWMVTTSGAVYAFGNAVYQGGANTLSTPLNGEATDIVRGTGGGSNGYTIVAEDGGVFNFGTAFWGSLPGDYSWEIKRDGNYCVDPETEIFTKRGWLHYDEVAIGDVTLAIDPNTGISDWQEIIDLYIGYRDGPMVLMNGQSHSSLTTPDHRWLTEYQGKRRWVTSETLTDLDGIPTVAALSFSDTFIDFVGSMTVEHVPYSGVVWCPTLRHHNWLARRDGKTYYTGNTDYCLDEETEILTPRGWVTIDEVTLDDSAYSMDLATNRASFVPIDDIYIGPPRERVMKRMVTTTHDSLSTLHHRWWVKQNGKYEWRVSDTLNHTSEIPIAAPSSDRPTVKTLPDDFVELVAWVWTEGTVKERFGVELSQSNKIGLDARIIRLLTRMYGDPGPLPRGNSRTSTNPLHQHKWNYRTREDGVSVFFLCADIGDQLRKWIQPNTKVVSVEFLMLLTQKQLELYIEVSLLADGYITKHSHVELSQKLKERADSFQLACVLAGEAVKVYGYSQGWMVSLLTHKFTSPVRSSTDARSGSDRNTIQNVPYSGRVWCLTVKDRHNFMVKRNGHVYFTGNSDIIRELLLWAGWLLYSPSIPASSDPEVFGTIQQTGVYNSTGDGCLPEDMFAQKTVIDVITGFKEIVGFNFFIDEEGGARFDTPNWYVPGNIVQETGARTAFVPTIDERQNLMNYQVDYTDAPVRSEIIVSTADPTADLTDTVTARLTVEDMAEESTALLRGMVKPMMWVNGTFQNQRELEIMAERVATQILFNQRTGSVTCAFNPAIQINDQVQIYERITSDVFVHYVRGIRTSHELETGQFNMTLETNWLGSGSDWLIDSWNINTNPNPGI